MKLVIFLIVSQLLMVEATIEDELTALSKRISALEKENMDVKASSNRRMSALEKENAEMKRMVFASQGKRQNKGNLSVAFSAIKDAPQEHLGINQNILFEKVLLNEGGGYHPQHGLFIAPQSGIYMFAVTAMSAWNKRTIVSLIRNGNTVMNIYGHGFNDHWDQGSQTAVIRLNAGDEVSVQNYYADDAIFGAMYSSFSGFLL